ncbi:hypothetical protein LIER_18416 [Lithospermum erythrorhizon]|uniref:Uncharacterized protein n=1 Tax=Lithospermum erythrorhizon TaxID=34254 RepID=A0AAV3QF65_LITER
MILVLSFTLVSNNIIVTAYSLNQAYIANIASLPFLISFAFKIAAWSESFAFKIAAISTMPQGGSSGGYDE